MNSISISIITNKERNPLNNPRPEYSPRVVLEKIQEYVEDVDSGMDDSSYQWKYLKALFLKLQARKNLSSIEKDLLLLIEPTIMKYGSDDPSFASKIEGHLLNRGYGNG